MKPVLNHFGLLVSVDDIPTSKLHKECIFIPKNNSGYGESVPIEMYRIYSNKYIALPVYLGLKVLGITEKDVDIKFPEPEKILLKDCITLKQSQIEAFSKILELKEKEFGGGIINIGTGGGKCHGLNTPILMYDGSIKLVQDIQTGDLLMGDTSTPRKVLGLATGREEMYEIKYKTGSYTVNKSHIKSSVNRLEMVATLIRCKANVR